MSLTNSINSFGNYQVNQKRTQIYLISTQMDADKC